MSLLARHPAFSRRWFRAIAVWLGFLAPVACARDADQTHTFDVGPPDFSGLVWLADSVFIAVHDSKSPDEPMRARVSLVWMIGTLGPAWRLLRPSWPDGELSSDLESAARLPGTSYLLFAESGDDGGIHRRLFLAELVDDSIQIVRSVAWPQEIYNVEGIAAARVGGELVFLYAERAHGEASTRIRWAALEVPALRFGDFQEVVFTMPTGTSMNRPVTAIEVDSLGAVYVASAYDPDVDDGPYSSIVWRVGNLEESTPGLIQVRLDSIPAMVGRSDGFKIEGLAIRNLPDGTGQLVMGTDDENLGAVLRPLRPGK